MRPRNNKDADKFVSPWPFDKAKRGRSNKFAPTLEALQVLQTPVGSYIARRISTNKVETCPNVPYDPLEYQQPFRYRTPARNGTLARLG